MDVLLVGSGGREHALALRLRQSPEMGKLLAAPGNAGIADAADEVFAVPATDVAGLIKLAKERRPDLVVVGPEAPLCEGLADALAEADIACFGPSQVCAQLEGSKAYTKQLLGELDRK